MHPRRRVESLDTSPRVYVPLRDVTDNGGRHALGKEEEDLEVQFRSSHQPPRGVQRNRDIEHFSDAGVYPETSKKQLRPSRKRQDIKMSIQQRESPWIPPAGSVWACCSGSEHNFIELQTAYARGRLPPHELFSIESIYSEVICSRFRTRLEDDSKICFVFKFGCAVGWDFSQEDRVEVLRLLRPFTVSPLRFVEDDDMDYCYAEKRSIKQDMIHLVTRNVFELLAYSYAFAQSCKCAVFETQVEEDIEHTRGIPLTLARTGKIKSNRNEISKRIGELFISRFYINLHSDILDTPDIFWEFDEFAEHYSSCRGYLEVPRRVEVLNQRLDIIKDLYDMLNSELESQHGVKLEWIVIYLVFAEVFIELVWNIFLKDILHVVG